MKDKSPKKAALYSAIIPGMGQIYTEKYWKAPIVYAGIITSVYFIDENNKQYKNYKEAALMSYETGDDQLGYSYSELKTLKDHYRRNRDISYFTLIGIYFLNILDASVNAHLYSFDVSDDISMNLKPYLSLYNSGVTLSLNL
ncbi:MAG: hypothetical protein CMD02_02355 [Flavobacteriales bacterium]|nr:hypothetical protein [Flavobacteriales bacterium]|tara:strand:+ start:538 stop:963 length:426 start_codon:yes stop_codon:yes gene_type:complete